MKEKGILMSGPMVVAIDEGRKTQDRRLVGADLSGGFEGPGIYNPAKADKDGDLYPAAEVFGIWDWQGEWGIKAPYALGDRLYLREAYQLDEYWDDLKPSEVEARAGLLSSGIMFLADGQVLDLPDNFTPGRYRSARFMPKAFVRIWLRVTDVRVERLREIAPKDALLEGIDMESEFASLCIDQADQGAYANGLPQNSPEIAVFANLWEKINGPGSWDTNPWVWVIDFKKEAP